MTDNLRADLERHTTNGAVIEFCDECGMGWPCDAARAIAALDDAEARLEVLSTAVFAVNNADQPLALDEALQELDRIRYDLAPSTDAWLAAHDRDIRGPLAAEIEMLRGEFCEEDGDGPCGACLKCMAAGYIPEANPLSKVRAAHDAKVRADERERLRGKLPGMVYAHAGRAYLVLAEMDALLDPEKEETK
jgi:hypothetical protein